MTLQIFKGTTTIVVPDGTEYMFGGVAGFGDTYIIFEPGEAPYAEIGVCVPGERGPRHTTGRRTVTASDTGFKVDGRTFDLIFDYREAKGDL